MSLIALQIHVLVGSVYDLSPLGAKALPRRMLTYHPLDKAFMEFESKCEILATSCLS